MIRMSTSTYAIIAMIIIGVVGVWSARRFNAELKSSHPSVWTDLARPNTFAANTIGYELRWTSFLLLRSYVKLDDRRLTRFGDIALTCGLLNAAIAISWAFIPHGFGPTPN
jgi:hypothetical protein